MKNLTKKTYQSPLVSLKVMQVEDVIMASTMKADNGDYVVNAGSAWDSIWR